MRPQSEPTSGSRLTIARAAELPRQPQPADSDMPSGRPVWAEVSASALRHNYQRMLQQAARSIAGIICVVKADAYGHGAVACARTLIEAGAAWFAVTSVDEGAELLRHLRQDGVRVDLETGRILVLSGVFSPGDASHAARHQLTPVLLSLQQAQWFVTAAQGETPPNEKYKVHLEIDTGMARNGVRWDDLAQLDAIAEILGSTSHCIVEAVMTHFSSPEDASSPQTRQQVQRFAQALAYLYAQGVRPILLHAGNSVTLFEASQIEALAEIAHTYGAKLLLGPGIALYGYGVAASELQPVLTWKTRITSLRRLQAGDPVSYGASFHTRHATTVATLAVGYADGYNRLLSGKGSVLIRGQRCAILGRVTMDQVMVDVTALEDIEVGEEVVLLGAQGEQTMLANQLATLTDTIPYEVLCAIQSRVPRIHIP